MLPHFKFVVVALGAVAVTHPIAGSWIPRGNVAKPDCPPIASIVINSSTSSTIGTASLYDTITDARYDAGFFIDRVGLTTIPSSTWTASL
jgi:hypothetical protein